MKKKKWLITIGLMRVVCLNIFMNKIIQSFIFPLLFLCSCNKQGDMKQISIQTIIHVDKIREEKFSISDISDSYYLVPLETSNDCLIKGIDKVYCTDSVIFILDRSGNNKVLVYALNGKYIKAIGSIGAGPQEYASLYDFCVDETSKHLYFLCDKNRIYKYDYEGNFMEVLKLDFSAVKIECNNDQLFFIGDELNRNNLIVTDISGQHVKYEFFSNTILGNNLKVLIHPFYKDASTVFYQFYLNNRIYGIKSDNELYVKYEFDFGNKAYTVDDQTKSYNSNQLKDVLARKRGMVKYIVENEDYVLFLFFDESQPCLGIYNVKNNTTVCYYYLSKNLTDDFIGMPTFPIFEYTYKNQFIAILNPADIFEHGLADKECFQYLNLSEDSNPILYFLNIKQIN